MIGLALVTFVAVLGQGLRTSVGDAVERRRARRLRRDRRRRRQPAPPAVGEALAARPGVERSAASGRTRRAPSGPTSRSTGVDPATIAAGRPASTGTPAPRRPRAARRRRRRAPARLRGRTRPRASAAASASRRRRASRLELTVRGIYSPPGARPDPRPDRHLARDVRRRVRAAAGRAHARHARGARPPRTRSKPALRRFPEAELQTRAEFRDARAKDDQRTTLSVLYVLLALSVIVSLLRDGQHARPLASSSARASSGCCGRSG